MEKPLFESIEDRPFYLGLIFIYASIVVIANSVGIVGVFLTKTISTNFYDTLICWVGDGFLVLFHGSLIFKRTKNQFFKMITVWSLPFVFVLFFCGDIVFSKHFCLVIFMFVSSVHSIMGLFISQMCYEKLKSHKTKLG